jgi:hypothetical protein
VNIWLEYVPDAILEAVKARLMRRRKDLQEDKEQKKREASEPGPQLVEFGGDSDEWRRPEPGIVTQGANYPVAAAYDEALPRVEPSTVFQNRLTALKGEPILFATSPDLVSRYSPDTSSVIEEADLSGVPRPGSGTRYLGITEFVFTRPQTLDLVQSFGLPVGKKNYIHCYWHRKLQAPVYARFRNYQARNFIVRPANSLSDDVTLETLVPAVGEVQPSPYTIQTDMKCILVSPAGVKEVTSPNDLIDKLNQFVAPIEFTPFSRQTNVDVVSLGYSTFPDVDKGSINVEYYTLAPASFFAPETNFFVNLAYHPLAKFGSRGSCFTPGVYALFDDPELGYDTDVAYADEDTPEGWSLMLSKLTGLKPKVGIASCVLDRTCNDEKIGFDVTKRPAAIEKVYKKNRKGDIPFVTEDPPNVYAWDWGQPEYCRFKALSLGFTSADLRP